MIYGVYLKIYLHVCKYFSMYVQYVLRCINNLEVDLHVQNLLKEPMCQWPS